MLRSQGTTAALVSHAPGSLDSSCRVLPSLNDARKVSSMLGICSSESGREAILDGNVKPESIWYCCREGKTPLWSA